MAFSANETFRRALAALQAGKINDAEHSFKKLLQAQPRHVAALNILSILLTQLGRFEEAEHYVRLALNENATSDATFYNYGIILKALKRPIEALERFGQALTINAAAAETWNNRGAVFNELSRFNEAIADFDKAISINSKYAAAYCNKGKSLAELKLYDQSFDAYDRALSLEPHLADAWAGRGGVFAKLKRYNDALAAYERALALNPGFAEAWIGRGNAFSELNQYNEAAAAYDRALALKPDLAGAWLGRGNALVELKQYTEAFTAYDRALALKPDLAEAWLGRGNIFAELKRYKESFDAFDRALTLKPEFANVWVGRGNIFVELKQYAEALAAYDRALALDPDFAEAWFGRGNLLIKVGQHHDAMVAYDKALTIKPDIKYAEGSRLHAKLHLCDWTNYDLEVSHLQSAIRNLKLASVPFPVLSILASPADQLKCAKRCIDDQPRFPEMWRDEIYSHSRIRVAYLSADFREHPVSYLVAGLFEQHDRSRFEMTAISLGPDQESAMRRRIKNSFEHFIDAQSQDDQKIAELIRRREIDIAIDLNGFTEGGRPHVFARRPAPNQVNYLGYSGTMGANFFDYVLADPTVIPEGQFEFYSEKVVWLPEIFMVNDSQRRISERAPTRSECGLPEKSFVFCCFNNTYKISPDVFHIWMRLLNATEGSVLWLAESNEAARANLRREAERWGVTPERLIFAPKVVDIADHLARQRQADLFLDTLPYNAHVTASDALWAGLPVLTCLGSTFAGRVAGSLLKAVGLSELITTSLEQYEALALTLARDPALLASIKTKLARNRDTYPLFDTKRFARHIESAYVTMWEKYQRGQPPASFVVNPVE